MIDNVFMNFNVIIGVVKIIIIRFYANFVIIKAPSSSAFFPTYDHCHDHPFIITIYSTFIYNTIVIFKSIIVIIFVDVLRFAHVLIAP